MKLVDGGIYRLKVSLFAHKWGEKSGMLGVGRMVLSGSEVYYSQEHEGWSIFGCLPPYIEYYCKVPNYLLEEQVEWLESENLVPRK